MLGKETLLFAEINTTYSTIKPTATSRNKTSNEQNSNKMDI